MPLYRVIRKSDQEQVYTYSADLPVEWVGFEFATHDHVEVVEPPAPPAPPPAPVTRYGGRRRLTKLEFIELLGDAAYGAILAMSKQSVAVEAWVKKLELATPEPDGTSINLDDERTQMGVQAIGVALQAQGVVDAEWAQGVLNG